MIDRALFRFFDVRSTAVGVILCSIAYSAFTILMALALAYAIVGVWQGAAIGEFQIAIALFAVGFMGRSVCDCIENASVCKKASAISKNMRTDFLLSLYDAGPRAISERGSGAVIGECIEGIDDVENYISVVFPKTLRLFIVPICLMGAIVVQDVISGLIVAVCYPLIIIYMRLIGHTASDEASKKLEGFKRMSNHFLDAVRGIDTIRHFGRHRDFSKSVFRNSEKYREATMKTLRIATLSSSVLDLFATCGLAAVAIMLGFRMVDGDVSFLPALSVLILVPEFFRPIRKYASDYHASLDGKASLAAVSDFIEKASKIASDETKGFPISFDPPSFSTRNISFSYDGKDDRVTFDDVSFDIPVPCKVAIIGDSGSGKTTLANLLSGFASPSSGEFQIGSDIAKSLKFADWQTHVAYIPQDPYIFNMSLRDNISFYCKEADDEAIDHAVECVGLTELVSMLPDGMDTVLGDGGYGISGGEAQRVALARAMMDTGRFIWVLDEPTSHLDLETEYDLKQKMLPLMEDKLVFIVTHRMHWLCDVDFVLDIENKTLKRASSQESSGRVSSGGSKGICDSGGSSVDDAGDSCGGVK